MPKERPNNKISRRCPYCDGLVFFTISEMRRTGEWRGKCLDCGQSCSITESKDPNSGSSLSPMEKCGCHNSP